MQRVIVLCDCCLMTKCCSLILIHNRQINLKQMKTKYILVALALLPALLFTTASRADIIATGSGNWYSTVPDAPWPGGLCRTRPMESLFQVLIRSP